MKCSKTRDYLERESSICVFTMLLIHTLPLEGHVLGTGVGLTLTNARIIFESQILDLIVFDMNYFLFINIFGRDP